MLAAKQPITDSLKRAAELPAMLVMAGDSSADPAPVVIDTPRGLVAAPCVTGGRSVQGGTSHRPPASGTGTVRLARLVTRAGRPDCPAPAARFVQAPCANRCFRGHELASVLYPAGLTWGITKTSVRLTPGEG